MDVLNEVIFSKTTTKQRPFLLNTWKMFYPTLVKNIKLTLSRLSTERF